MSVNIWSNGNLVPIASSGTYVYNMPLGSIIAFSGDNIPVGFLLCDGSTLNKNEYLDLFNVIGYTYGGSDNEFKLPDLRDKFAQGANGNLGEVIEAGLPNIIGRLGAPLTEGGTGNYEIFGAYSGSYKSGNSDGNLGDNRQRNGTHIFNASKGETKTDGTLKTSDEHHVYGASDTVQPPAVAINYIIKATDYSQATEDVIDDSKTTTGNVWSAAKIKEEIDNKNNYSTEETVIGKWIDGKPIYRKVFTGLLLDAKDKWVSLKPIDNEDIIISATWYTSTSIGGRSHTFGHLLTTFYNNNLDINARGNMVESEKIDTVIIEYTKTTN